MTTQSWSSRINHSNTTTFREWGSELSGMLAAAGLVQTADTGQINWGSVSKPAAGVFAGYEIWRFDDSLQGTAPIFFKIEYGTNGGNANAPGMRIGVGIASDGAGGVTTIGGGAATQRQINNQQGLTSDTALNSYLCVTEGFMGLSWKQNTGGQGEASFFVSRTVDNTGAPTALGAMVMWGSGNTSRFEATQAMRFAATAELYTVQTAIANTALCLNPQSRSVSTVGSDVQAFLAWTITPSVAPLVGVCGVINSEIVAGNTFSLPLVGTTARNYIALTQRAGPMGGLDSTAAGGLKPAMLWE